MHILTAMLLHKWRQICIIITTVTSLDVKLTSSGRHFAKGHSKTFDKSVVAMVTDL